MKADSGIPEIPTFVFCHTSLTKHRGISDGWDVGKGSAYGVPLNYPSVQHVLERGNTVIVNTGHYYGGEGCSLNPVEGIEYATGRHFVHGAEPEYGGDVRLFFVDSEARTAEVRYYDVDDDEEGTLVTPNWYDTVANGTHPERTAVDTYLCPLAAGSWTRMTTDDMTDRPNVLVVLTDQQRWDTVGAYGSPMDLTPNLDALAEDGARASIAR